MPYIEYPRLPHRATAVDSLAAGLRSPFRITVVAMFAAASFSGCFLNSEPPLRIGISPWPGYEFLHLAQDKGFFEAEGVDVRLIEFGNMPDATNAFVRQNLDGFTSTVVEVLEAWSTSPRRPVIVRVLDYSNGADVVVVKPGIDGMAALKGKRIAVELSAEGGYFLSRALESSGLTMADVTTKYVDLESMGAGFAAGDFDAVVTYPPASIPLTSNGAGHVVFSSAEIPGEILDVLAFDAATLEDNPGRIAAFLRALDRAYRFAADNPSEADAIMAAHEGISPAEFRATIDNGIRILHETDQAEYLSKSGKIVGVLERTARVMGELGHTGAPPATDAMFTDAFAGQGSSEK